VYYQSFAEVLRDMAIEVPLRAGEAVVFNNATIHGATDNESDRRRLAATLLVCSEQAQWQIYFNDTGRSEKPIERYELDFDTFIHMPKNGRPAERALREKFDYAFPQISEREFREKTGNGSKPKNSVYQFFSNGLKAILKK
jgi:ectoine hydroxylase-related dioxygenase (phytanoyl-CoA dioxygenase family)